MRYFDIRFICCPWGNRRVLEPHRGRPATDSRCLDRQGLGADEQGRAANPRLKISWEFRLASIGACSPLTDGGRSRWEDLRSCAAICCTTSWWGGTNNPTT